jgi:predicted dithiol-disulfide oxidoreductase (DUF899 family)
MSLPTIASRAEWLEAREDLLRREKELTRRHDTLNADRRRLPMVLVEKPYVFEGADGEARLVDMFGDHRQLIVQHFMFGPDWDSGCPGCTASADELAPGTIAHLHERDTGFALVSRAPLAKLEAYRRQRGWTLPWYSSYRSDFNRDFEVTVDRAGAEQPVELPAVSCFLRDGGDVYHTYSTSGRGTEYLAGAYTFLDLTALGRQEGWEEPRGRVANPHPPDPSFSE